MLVMISLAGKGQLLHQVRVQKFVDAQETAQRLANQWAHDVIMFDTHGKCSRVISPTRAGQVENGEGGHE